MTFRVYGDSMMGPYHEKKSTPNQDAYTYKKDSDKIALAVADGAGSLKRSHVGSRVAVETSVDKMMCHDDPPENRVRYAIEASRNEIFNHSKPQELGCTLAIATIAPDGWSVGVVGDAFAIIHYDDHHELVTSEKISEYANITKLLTSDDWSPTIVSGRQDIRGISLSSDGLVNVALKNDLPFDGFWNTIIAKAEDESLDVNDLLQWIEDQGRIDDDTTLLVVAT